jgi:hypothetical protein
VIPPTMKAAFTQLQRISANDPGIEQAKNICGEDLVDSMKLEEVRRSPCPPRNSCLTFAPARRSS